MTTPDTSDVRSWARDNGFDVADRGRLPAKVVDAYSARTKGAAAVRPAKSAPAVPTPAAKKASPPRPAARRPATTQSAAKRAGTAKKAGTAAPPAAKAAAPPTAKAAAPPTAKAAAPPTAKAATPPPRTAPATRTPRTAPKPTPPAAARSAASRPVEDPTQAFADASLQAVSADPSVPQVRSTDSSDRLALLAEQVRLLTDRVAALEGGSAKPGKSRFRRQR